MLSPAPAHAFLFLLLAAQEDDAPAKPPEEVQGFPLNPDVALRPEGLPAPFLMRLDPREMPPVTLAQASTDTSPEAILKRLEALEQENAALKKDLAAAKKAPREGLPGDALPRQTRYGIWVHIHDWSPAGVADPGSQTNTYVYEPQTFPATIGYTDHNNLRTFRFEAWFRVKTAGTYQLGGLLDCGEFRHPCVFAIRLDGTEVLREEIEGSNTIQYAERFLEPGDYRIEYIWGLTRNKYIKYSPHKVMFTPRVRTPEDMNFRDFREDELLVPDRQDVPIGPTLDFGR